MGWNTVCMSQVSCLEKKKKKKMNNPRCRGERHEFMQFHLILASFFIILFAVCVLQSGLYFPVNSDKIGWYINLYVSWKSYSLVLPYQTGHKIQERKNNSTKQSTVCKLCYRDYVFSVSCYCREEVISERFFLKGIVSWHTLKVTITITSTS